ncbi:hypothetical protein AMST5_01322 [freshwater sediment metagenome]|uniref:PKD/Chitinase domain-containing protein n=1 Tax=freshwater sediment metagenome TaxID=556182 RepID=A0AA48LZV5_9ZZZZ
MISIGCAVMGSRLRIQKLFLALLVAVTTVCHLVGFDAFAQSDQTENGENTSLPFPRGNVADSPETLDNYPHAPTFRGYYPERYDLSNLFPPPRHQIGPTCTAWAVGWAARSYYANVHEKRPVRNGNSPVLSNIPSPSYIYRAIRRNCAEQGTSIADAFKLLHEHGALSESQYPSSIRAQRCVSPSQSIEEAANDFRIDGFHFIVRDSSQDFGAILEKLKGAIGGDDHLPVLLSVRATREWDALHKGEASIRNATECRAEDKGNCNHAVVAVGYDERRQAIKIMNSWGRNWGEGGFAWLTYETLAKIFNEGGIIEAVKPTPEPKSPTCVFRVVPYEIDVGGEAELHFSSQNAKYGYIDNGIGRVGQEGRVTIRPRVSTDYIATFYGDLDNVTCAARLLVAQPPADQKPTISSFVAAPGRITAGESATLTWSVTDADTLSIEPGVGKVSGTSLTVRPNQDVTYTLTATNRSGSATATAKIDVAPSPKIQKPTISSFDAEPRRITAGESANLTWSVTDADTLSIEPGVGKVSGTSLTVRPNQDVTYTLTATNRSGSATATAKIDVAPSPKIQKPTISSFDAEPRRITAGESANLTWSVTDADTLSIEPGVGKVSGTSLTVRPNQDVTYTLTATNRSGSATATAKIDVAPSPKIQKPTISSFDAEPRRITAGESANLTWSVTDADTVSIEPGVGKVSGNKVAVRPSSNTTYKLTARNRVGSSTSAITLSVSGPPKISLPDIRCGRVEIANDSGRQKIVGFVGYADDIQRIRDAASGMDVQIDLRPFPQCEALLTLQKALNRAGGLKVRIRRGLGDMLAEGDNLILDVETPKYPSYVNVAYIDAAGNVLNLIQPGLDNLVSYAPRSKISIGDELGTERRFRIAPPLGREMLIALAAKSPIFPEPRPSKETEREFLTALRRALLVKSDLSEPDREVDAAFDAIVTTGRQMP